MLIRLKCMVLVALAVAAISVAAQSCVPGRGFVDTARPVIAQEAELVSHTEEVVIDRPLPVVLSVLDKPIKDTIKKGSSLPGVSGDYMLAGSRFEEPGSRRMDCLSDGSTLEEEVLANDRGEGWTRFRYVVWNYTSEAARAIVYGVGEFHYSDAGNGSTRVVWTYSFRLNDARFPGELGCVGRYLFRVGFLDRQYADMMRATLQGTKKDAEDVPLK